MNIIAALLPIAIIAAIVIPLAAVAVSLIDRNGTGTDHDNPTLP